MQDPTKLYQAHYLVPVVYRFMASNDEEAMAEAIRLGNKPKTLVKLGDPGCPDLGCDALIQDERTIFEV